ncbi:MAG: hypothetical protein EAZ52_02395 [Alphaproteobacteria bacterium]|nr:MAG: hypothetical protein EAZ52_02395 [Alphaproteobacteria bacterium]
MVTFQSLRHLTRTQSLMETPLKERNPLREHPMLNAAKLNAATFTPFEIPASSLTERAMRQTVARAQTLLNVADEGLHHIGQALERMHAIANESSLETTSDNARAMLQTEFMQLRDHISNIAHITEFEGMTLLNGNQVLDARSEAFFERATMSVETQSEAEQTLADTSKALHLLTEKQSYIAERRANINFTPTELSNNVNPATTIPTPSNNTPSPQLPSEFAQLFNQWNPTEMIQAQGGRTQQEPWRALLMSSLFGR